MFLSVYNLAQKGGGGQDNMSDWSDILTAVR